MHFGSKDASPLLPSLTLHLQGFSHEFDLLMLQRALAYKTAQSCVSVMPSVDTSTDTLDGPPLPLLSSLVPKVLGPLVTTTEIM